MPTPFDGHEVEARLRPSAEAYRFDLDQALASMVALEATIPADAYTAPLLGTERVGNGVVISLSGLVVTMAYLITEAEEVVLTRNDGRRVSAHVLGLDARSGLGLVQALDVEAMKVVHPEAGLNEAGVATLHFHGREPPDEHPSECPPDAAWSSGDDFTDRG